jgi:hypothetical protein
MESDNDAIDLLGYACSDARRYHQDELTGDFTKQDVRESLKKVLAELMVRQPTDADADAVLEF